MMKSRARYVGHAKALGLAPKVCQWYHGVNDTMVLMVRS